MNTVNLIGRIGQDPIMQDVNGTKKVKLSLATSTSFKNQAGEKIEKTHWHSVEAWGKQAEILGQYVNKGDQLGVVGTLEYNQYEKEGVKKTFAYVRLSSFTFISAPKQNERQVDNKQFEPESAGDDLPF